MKIFFKNKINRKKMSRGAVFAIVALSIFVSSIALDAYVSAIKVISDKVTRDNINEQLEDAAYINIVVNTMRKCVGSIGGNDGEYIPMMRGKNALNGKIMMHNTTDISTSLQIEGIVQGHGDTGWKDGNGTIWCYQGEDGRTSIYHLFAKVMDQAGITEKEILCNGGQPGIIRRVDDGDRNCEHFEDDTAGLGVFDCGIFGSGQCVYWMSAGEDQAKAHLQSIYEKFYAYKTSDPTSEAYNPYVPTWSEIGNFNNVDGYFLYISDFNYRCDYSESSKDPHSDWSPVVIIDRADKKISFTRKYYHIAENSSWADAISTQHPAKTCKELLAGIERLRKQSNEVETRTGGYQGIIVAELKRACKEAKTSDGQNAWEVAKKKLEDILADSSSSDELKTDAQKSLDELNQIIDSGNYVKTEGDIETGDSMIMECYSPEAFEIDVHDYDPAADPGDLVDPVAGETGPTCYDRAASLGWILCPIIEQVADAIQYIYEQIIMPFLELDIGLFASNNATHDVWSKIRDMANIGFIIFFIFVIFSQLTGVGIDNYGIKKVLPKLIVGAILINLSYVICQLSVDLSNILGYGIKSIFEGLSPKIDEITVAQEGAFGKGNTHSVAGTFILLIGIVAAITAAAILALGPHILIPVFMGLISIVIAIIFCFVLLAVRKAFAVLLVIISPLAFMCYILPNTKSLFDKWFNAFKAMLLAFPICSAMIYGGQFVGSLLIDAADATNVPFTLALCAAVISVMPVFMIPKVIRGSMAMISNGLTRMQGALTGRARGAAAHGLNNSRMMTRYDQNRAAKRAARQTAYNAKKGQRYIDRQNRKGNADLTKMSPAARAAYLNAQGGVDAQDKQMQDAWSTKFSEMEKGDEGRADSLIEMANNGKLDKNALIAGMSSISDSDQMTRAFNAIHGSANGKALLKDSKTRSAVAGSLKSSKSVINQSMGKLVAKSPDGTFTHEELRDKVQGAGTSVMASQDKDTFKSEGAMDLFSKEQLAAGMGAGYSGADAAAFSQMMMGDETKAAEALSTMSASQVAGMSTDMFKSKEEGGMGSEFIKNNVSKDAINTLNSEDGARLRASMNADVKKVLGITGDGGSSSESTPAPAPENDGGGSTGGGWVDDSGNPITSPAQLTDDDLRYANKLKEMSQRGSDGSTLSVDHDSSSTTSEPMRGEHGRGINDATGKERAAEGNRLDYHPKMKGETNADYSARAQWEKEMARRAEAAGPRDSAKETPSQWQTRAGIESFESWRGKQNR